MAPATSAQFIAADRRAMTATSSGWTSCRRLAPQGSGTSTSRKGTAVGPHLHEAAVWRAQQGDILDDGGEHALAVGGLGLRGMPEAGEVLRADLDALAGFHGEHRAVRSGQALVLATGLLDAVQAVVPDARRRCGWRSDLREHGVDSLTLGQYLRPSPPHLPVVRFPLPEEFVRYREVGEALGSSRVESGPLTRSSYHTNRAVVPCPPQD